jgi:hypothetical protein
LPFDGKLVCIDVTANNVLDAWKDMLIYICPDRIMNAKCIYVDVVV